MMKNKMSHHAGSIIVAEEKGPIIGCVFIIYDPWASFIYHLAVDPKYRKRGIGTKLLREAEKRLVKRGTNPITIFIHETNERSYNFFKKRSYGNETKVWCLERLKRKPQRKRPR